MERQKTLTVTFHRAINYGAVYQAYGLQQTLFALGYDNEIIDLSYEKNCIYTSCKKSTLKGFLGAIKYNAKISKKRGEIEKSISRFENFISCYLKITQNYSTYEEFLKNIPYADFYITGSDQVWNLSFFPELKDFYLLGFVEKGKRLSYAASMGKYMPNCSTEIKEALNKFYKISVREKSALKYLEDLELNCKCFYHIDPVFLLEQNQWKQIQRDCREEYGIDGKYILCYELIAEQKVQEILDFLADRYKYKKVVVTLKRPSKLDADYTIIDAGPCEFLGLVDKAEIVISTSFHGMAMSIIMNKQFYVLPMTASERFSNCLNLFHLEEQLVKRETEFKEHFITNYEEVNCIIEEERKKSLDYLSFND